VFHAGINTDPDRQRLIGYDRRHLLIDASIPRSHIDECRFRTDEAVLDLAQILVRAERSRQVRHRHGMAVIPPRACRLGGKGVDLRLSDRDNGRSFFGRTVLNSGQVRARQNRGVMLQIQRVWGACVLAAYGLRLTSGRF
jgi:hypothetical protein